MNLAYMNRTDIIVFLACLLSLFVSLFNMSLDSVALTYIDCIVVLVVFTYWALRKDPTEKLKSSLTIGSIGGVLYIFVDKYFVMLRIITYLRPDVKLLLTPVSVVLIWICYITVMMYLYHRFRSIIGIFPIPAILTAAAAFGSAILLSYFAGEARLWVWNTGVPAMPSISSTPLFVPVAFAATFLLSPYIVGGQRFSARVGLSKHPVAAGLRCAIVMSLFVYVSFRIFIK